MASVLRAKRWRLSAAQIVVLSFGIVIAIGTLLLGLPAASANGQGIGWVNAFFTASSATCVTGLVVVTTGVDLSLFGQLVVLVLIQVGGLGLMTMTTALFLLLGWRIGLRGRLLIQESLGQTDLSGLVRLVRSIIVFTLTWELLGATVLALRFRHEMPTGQAVYFGIFHAVSAFCNAGFDLFGNSMERFAADPTVVLTVTSLFILGGLGFLVLRNVRHHKREGRLVLHTKVVLRMTAYFIVAGFALVLALEHNNPGTLGPLPLHGKILSAWFTAVTPRTAGFNTVPTALLNPATLMLLMIWMFVGASPGGTGGGIKTTTMWVLLQSVRATIKGRREVESNSRTVPRMVIDRAVAIVVLALGMIAGVTALLSLTEQSDFIAILFETVSAFGTVGLSMGLTPELSTIGRIVLPLTMLAGRVGPFTLIVALNQIQPPADVRLPEEKVLVG